MLTSFPNRVWFEVEKGKWASRTVTRQDNKDRKLAESEATFRKFQRDLTKTHKAPNTKLRRKA